MYPSTEDINTLLKKKLAEKYTATGEDINSILSTELKKKSSTETPSNTESPSSSVESPTPQEQQYPPLSENGKSNIFFDKDGSRWEYDPLDDKFINKNRDGEYYVATEGDPKYKTLKDDFLGNPSTRNGNPYEVKITNVSGTPKTSPIQEVKQYNENSVSLASQLFGLGGGVSDGTPKTPIEFLKHADATPPEKTGWSIPVPTEQGVKYITPNTVNKAKDFLQEQQQILEAAPEVGMLGTLPMNKMTKVLAKSYLGGLQTGLQGVSEIQNTPLVAEQEGKGAATLNATAGLVKTAFGGASAIVPSLIAFNAATQGAEEVLPKDVVPMLMSPFTAQFRREDQYVNYNDKLYKIGGTSQGTNSGLELLDLAYNIVAFKGAHEGVGALKDSYLSIADKIKSGQKLNADEVQVTSDAINEAAKENGVTHESLNDETLSKIPKDLPTETKVEVAPLIEEKQSLESQKQKIESDKSKLDESFHESENKKISSLDEQIKNKQGEIVAVLDKTSKSESIELPVESEKPTTEENAAVQSEVKPQEPIVQQTEVPQIKEGVEGSGVGGDVMKGVNDKMRQTKLEMEFKSGNDKELSFKNNDVEIVVAKPIGAGGKYSVTVSEKSNSNTGFTLNEEKTKLFDTKLEALDYAKEQKDQSLPPKAVKESLTTETPTVEGKDVSIEGNIEKTTPPIEQTTEGAAETMNVEPKVEVKPETPKVFTEKGKRLADKIRSYKSKPLELKDEFGNPLQIDQKGIDLNQIIDAIADTVEKGAELADAIKEHLEKQDWYKALTVKGKEAVSNQLMNHLGESSESDIQSPIRGTGSGQVVKKPVGDDVKYESQFGKRVVETEELSPEARAEIEKTVEYVRQSNGLSAAEAKTIIAKIGLERAYDVAVNDVSVDGGTRVVIGQAAIKTYNDLFKKAKTEEEKNFYLDRTIQTARGVQEKLATQAGRMVQAFSLWDKLSPEAQLRDASKEQEKLAQHQLDKRKKDIEQIVKRVRDANTEAVNEILGSEPVKKEIQRVKKTTQEKLSKVKEQRNKIIEKYRKNGRNLLSANGLSKEGIEFVGEITASYIKEGVIRLSDLVDNAIAHLKDAIGESAVSDELKNKVQFVVQDILGKEGDRLAKGGIEDMEVNVKKVIQEHYTKPEAIKKSLSEKIIANTSLEGNEAQALATHIEKAFDRIATKKKNEIFDAERKRFERIQKKLQGAKKVEPKAIQDEIIKYSNLGAFTDAEISNIVADRLGLGKLTPKQAEEIIRLSNRIQDAPEGSPKREATEDLLNYRANLAGKSIGEVSQGVWYANVLSGYTTHVKNIVSTWFNGMLLFGAEAVRDPVSIPYMMSGIVKGLGRRGLPEALNTITTGRSPIHYTKIEAGNVLERTKFFGGFFNPANYLKYVTRLMVAEDVFAFQGLKEMRATQLALSEARKQGFKATTKAGWDKVNEILLNTPERYTEATTQATTEGLKGSQHRRRVWELMEDNREVQMTEDAYGFAAKGTFNHETEGSLGALTNAVSSALDAVAIGNTRPLRFVVPFTKIITNVANNALDFSPVGLARAARGKRGFRSFEDSQLTNGTFKELSTEERKQLVARASLGIGLTAGLIAMDNAGTIQITGAGTGDAKKDLQLRNTGWEPYSIKVGDTYVSYKYTPLVLNLALYGNYADRRKYGGDDDETDTNRMMSSAWSTGSLLLDMTWVGGTSDLMSSLAEPKPDMALKKVQYTLGNLSKSFVVPNLYTQLAQEYESINNLPRKEANGVWQQTIQHVPIARNSMNDKIDGFGDPIPTDVNIFTSKQTEDPIKKFASENNLWIPPINKNSIIVFDSKTQKDRPITDDEYYNFSKVRGNKIKNKISELLSTGTKTDEIKEQLTKIKSTATREAKSELFSPKSNSESEQEQPENHRGR